MSYTIRLEDDRGHILDEVPGATAAFNIAVSALDPSDYPWLATLDRYGDSTFNRLQVHHVIEELKRLQGDVQDAETEAVIAQTIRLAERARDEGPNRYLRFYGD